MSRLVRRFRAKWQAGAFGPRALCWLGFIGALLAVVCLVVVAIVNDQANGWLAVVLFASVFGLIAAAASMAWYLGHRRFPDIGYVIFGGLALIVVLLSAHGYAACTDGRVPGFSHAYHGLRLLLGDAPDGCQPLPLTAELARYLGLAGVLVAAIQVIMEMTSSRVSAWVARFARRVTLVIGLDECSLPVIGALVADPNSGLVVVLEKDRENPLVRPAKAMGARVVIGRMGQDSRTKKLLKQIATAFPKHLTLQAVYLLSNSDGINLSQAQTAEELLRELGDGRNRRPVPTRFIVRVDDYRVARQYVAAQCARWADEQSPGVLTATLGRNQVTAQGLALRIWRNHGGSRLLIVGESDLSIAVHDEMRFLHASARLLGEDSPGIEAEMCAAGDLSRAIGERGGRETVILVAEEVSSAELERYASLCGVAAVYAHRDSHVGIATTAVLGKVYHFGLSLGGAECQGPNELSRSPLETDPLAGVPQDSWSRVARLVHAMYAKKTGARPWEQLTFADRQSNFRGLYATIRGYARLGYVWGNDPQPELTEGEHELLLEEEHGSWCEFKQHYGWVRPKPGKLARNDCLENDLIMEWAEIPPPLRDRGRRQTLESIGLNVKALAALGFYPARGRYRGVGRVELLGEATREESWTASTGATMHAAPGDLWISSNDEPRSIKRDRFERGYRWVEGNRYERVGEVEARRAVPGRCLETLEGLDEERDGFWVVTDENGNSWQVSADYFARTYLPITAEDKGTTADGYDPEGPVFISYRRSDGTPYAELLDTYLRAAGVAPWRDLVDLPPGETAVRIQDAMRAGISSAILIVTPELGDSDFVAQHEIPILHGLDRDTGFQLLILNTIEGTCPGEIDVDAPDRMLKEAAKRLGIEPLELRLREHKQYAFLPERVELRQMVADLLRERLRSRADALKDNEVKIQTQTRPAPDATSRWSGPNPIAKPYDLMIRLRQDPTGIPQARGYRALKDTLSLLVDALYAKGVDRVTLTGGGHFSLGWAIGAALPITWISAGALVVIDPEGKRWGVDAEPVPDQERCNIDVQPSDTPKGPRVVWLRASGQGNDEPVKELAEKDGYLLSILTVDNSIRPFVINSNQGEDLAQRIAGKLRELAGGGAHELHLVSNLPVALTTLVAARANTLNCVLYELGTDPTGRRKRYFPTIRVRAGEAGGPITQVLARFGADDDIAWAYLEADEPRS